MSVYRQMTVVLVLIITACFATQDVSEGDSTLFIAANNPQLQYTGRVAKIGSQVFWQWPGVGVAANLQCPQTSITVQVHLSVGAVKAPMLSAFEDSKYNVLVDGSVVGSFLFDGKSDSYSVSLPATSRSVRSLEVIKNGEIMAIPILFSMSEKSPGTAFSGISVPNSCTLSAPPARPARRLEFLGDSITCGFGNLATGLAAHLACVNPLEWGHYEDFSLGFPTLLSKEFQAEMHTQCISQVGITRNGATLAKTTLFNMSHYVHRTLPTLPDDGLQWDYKAWTPDVAVVNLGTNDYDLAEKVHEQPSAAFFEEKYTSFLVDYVSRYDGRLPAILIACGPMTKTQCPYVSKVADNVKAAFPALKVKYLELTAPKLDGCISHPDADDDKVLQKQMSPVISDLTGWAVAKGNLIV